MPGRTQDTTLNAASDVHPRNPGISSPRLPSAAGQPMWRTSTGAVRMGQTHVWDARDPAEWDGTARIGGLPAGRIAGAQFIGWRDFRRSADGRPSEFRSAAEISALLAQAGFEPGHDHIFYCHSGVRAATPLFALYLMGYPVERLHLYDGSWIEWSRRTAAN